MSGLAEKATGRGVNSDLGVNSEVEERRADPYFTTHY
jgi:hypothetical protein